MQTGAACSPSGVETNTAFDFRTRDHLIVVGGVKVGAGQLRQLFGVGRILVGDGDEAHRRVLGGEPRAQRADAARADDGDAEVFRLHALLPQLWSFGNEGTAGDYT